jgi:hypothetical protein
MLLFTGSLNYNSATFEILFTPYNNTCSDRYLFRLLILIIDSEVWPTYSIELHLILFGEITNIALIIRADVLITISCPMS